MAKAAPETFVGETPNMAPSMAHLALAEQMNNASGPLNKRNMVLDEERFEKQFLLCGVCKDRFHSNSLPRMLPCHHSFCQLCIDRIYQHATENRQSQPIRPSQPMRPSQSIGYASSFRPLSANCNGVGVNCPACNKPFLATDDGIQQLPTDHRVVQLMDFVHHTERQTVTFCSRHSLQPLNFFCEGCIRPVCRDCTVEEHREEEGHVVLDLNEAITKFTPLLDTSIAEMDAEGAGIEEKRNTLEAVTKTLDGVKVDLLGQIKDCMSRLRGLIDDRERELEDKVHEEIQKEKSKLMEKSNMLENRRYFLNDQGKKLRAAREDNNVEEMFHVHQEVREQSANASIRIREVDDGLMTSFMLNTRDETMLASRIKNFGDVTGKVETTSSRNKASAQTYSNLYRSSSFR